MYDVTNIIKKTVKCKLHLLKYVTEYRTRGPQFDLY